jgi:hypothetical protein
MNSLGIYDDTPHEVFMRAALAHGFGVLWPMTWRQVSFNKVFCCVCRQSSRPLRAVHIAEWIRRHERRHVGWAGADKVAAFEALVAMQHVQPRIGERAQEMNRIWELVFGRYPWPPPGPALGRGGR